MPSALNFDNLMRPTVRCSSESQSEVSSVESERNDIANIALQLGISNQDELIDDRFKVDRQKLENLIKGTETFGQYPSAQLETPIGLFDRTHSI